MKTTAILILFALFSHTVNATPDPPATWDPDAHKFRFYVVSQVRFNTWQMSSHLPYYAAEKPVNALTNSHKFVPLTSMGFGIGLAFQNQHFLEVSASGFGGATDTHHKSNAGARPGRSNHSAAFCSYTFALMPARTFTPTIGLECAYQKTELDWGIRHQSGGSDHSEIIAFLPRIGVRTKHRVFAKADVGFGVVAHAKGYSKKWWSWSGNHMLNTETSEGQYSSWTRPNSLIGRGGIPVNFRLGIGFKI